MSEVTVRERYLKNGKKVYEYCFELAHEGGKRRRRTKSGFATKREARAAGRQALYEYENVGEVVVDNNISYSDFLDFWIENDCSNDCWKCEGSTDTYKQGIWIIEGCKEIRTIFIIFDGICDRAYDNG